MYQGCTPEPECQLTPNYEYISTGNQNRYRGLVDVAPLGDALAVPLVRYFHPLHRRHVSGLRVWNQEDGDRDRDRDRED